MKDLTAKQKLFCEYYIENWNGTKAAIRAGYSENTACEIASENLRKPQIKAHIDEIQSDLQKLAGISRLSIINELKTVAFGETDNLHAKLKGIEIINKMLGFNEPDRIEQIQENQVISISHEDRIEIIKKLEAEY